jgi:hypothetical protein
LNSIERIIELDKIGRFPGTWVGLAAIVYLAAAGGMWAQQSLAPHYILLAEAFLEGQLGLGPDSGLYDLMVTERGSFVAGSPLPAVLLMPLVAWLSPEFSDVLFSIGLAALTVGVVQAIFGRVWLTLFFALGTPMLLFASLGTYWYQAQQVAIFFALLTLLAAWRWQRWGVAGLFFALATLARPILLFAAPAFLLLLWQTRTGSDRALVWRRLLFFVAPLLLSVGLSMAYNVARFGHPTDFGYASLQGAPNITAAYVQYGGFHPHFLGCNLFVSLLNPPEINGWVPAVLYSACDHLLAGVDLVSGRRLVMPNPLGMSLFLTMPALLLIFGAGWRQPVVQVAWLGLLGVMVPVWLFHNTGSTQFGYRYAFDAAPFFLLLCAAAVPPEASVRRRWLAAGLVVLSVGMTLWGWWWLYGLFVGQTWWQVLVYGRIG